METLDFNSIREQFCAADVEKKIELYVNSTGLTQDQYKELLRLFPINELGRLEAAL